VDKATHAIGRIEPEGREQVIASLEGGILREMYVREGMQVSEGQDLAQLDPTRFEA
jgi:adhesin transport system membrane fusion protein